MIEAQALGQLPQGEALALADVDEDPELLGREAVTPQAMADGLLDAAAGGSDQEADWFLLRQLLPRQQSYVVPSAAVKERG